jgi:LysR family glycine cleavage system transcriptional activator
MIKLPVNALRTFAAVYDAGGVRPAARALKVAHSSVSRHLGELETWLGVPLFEHREGRRPLQFTAQGDALGRVALASFGQIAQAVQSAREEPRRNAVTISTTPSIAALWLLPRLTAFQSAHPGIALSVVVEQKLVEPESQRADLAIRMGRGPWSGLICEPLMDDDLYPVMSRDYWTQSGQPTAPDALLHMHLLHDRDPNASWATWLSEYGPDGIEAEVGTRFSSSDLVLRASAQGLGVALARGRLAADFIKTGALISPFNNMTQSIPDAYWIVRSETARERFAISTVRSWLKTQSETNSVQVGTHSGAAILNVAPD